MDLSVNPTVCPDCSADVPSGARFCRRCGHALAGPAQEAPAVSSRRTQPPESSPGGPEQVETANQSQALSSPTSGSPPASGSTVPSAPTLMDAGAADAAKPMWRRPPGLAALAITVLAIAGGVVAIIATTNNSHSRAVGAAVVSTTASRSSGNIQAGAPASAASRSAGHGSAQSVTLSLRPTAGVYVCLIGDNGRKVIPGIELQPGVSTPTYDARRFQITLGNSSLTMFVDGRARTVPASSQAIGYSITPAGRRTLPAGQLPTCK